MSSGRSGREQMVEVAGGGRSGSEPEREWPTTTVMPMMLAMLEVLEMADGDRVEGVKGDDDLANESEPRLWGAWRPMQETLH